MGKGYKGIRISPLQNSCKCNRTLYIARAHIVKCECNFEELSLTLLALKQRHTHFMTYYTVSCGVFLRITRAMLAFSRGNLGCSREMLVESARN